MEPLWDAIKNSQQSIFRFEGLQDYSAEDGEEVVSCFVKTGQLQNIPDANNKWWSDMKLRNEKGIVTQRVRLVIEPKTNYTKMELEYLRIAKAYSGDDIRIIQEEDFRFISLESIPDFYIIDESRLFLMNYGSEGKYLNSVESDEVIEYVRLKNLLIQSSLPL
jgi:hypothetical protein